MLNNSEYCITAGEFAKLGNTTRDTLRYYDKTGILIPKKNKINGYNYYSPAQITSFFFINFFRSVGCPINELKIYMNETGTDGFNTFLYSQYESLLRTKEELEQKITIMSKGIEIINHTSGYTDGVVILEHFNKPLTVFVTDVKSSPATTSGEIITDLTRHISRCSKKDNINSFPLGAVIDYSCLKKGIYTYKQVFSIASCPDDTDTYTLPSTDMVCCIQKDSTGDSSDIYSGIINYINEHNLTAKSDLFSLSLMNIVNIHDERKYMKYIFVCV